MYSVPHAITYTSTEEEKQILDSTDHLKSWGFHKSSYAHAKRCAKCGIANSDLDGNMMQCAKCKQTYYCSKNCFNSDMVDHLAFCKTGKLKREPRRTGDITGRKGDDEDTDSATGAYRQNNLPKLSVENPEDAKGGYCPTFELNQREKGDEDPTDTELDEDVDDFADEETDKAPESEMTTKCITEAGIDPGEKESEKAGGVEGSCRCSDCVSAEEDDEAESSSRRRGCVSGEDDEDAEQRRLKVGNGEIPEYSWEKETVDLQEAETIKREYRWHQPSWVLNSPLKKTNLGKIVREQGSMARTKRENFRNLPEWAKKLPLKGTED